MVNVQKLKGRMVEKGLTQEDVATLLNIDRSTFNRKINSSDGQYLTVKEVGELMDILSISDPVEYFFAHKLRKSNE
jgi:transcriptional regulator with XRE-family HTH domain